MSATTSRNDLFHGLFEADTVESKIDTGHGSMGKGCLFRLSRQFVDARNRVDLARVNSVCRTETLGKCQFFIVKIDCDDGVRAAHFCPDHGRQTNAADTEDRYAVASLNVCGVDHRTRTGHDGAAYDGGNIFLDRRIHFDHELLVGNRVICPRKDILRNSLPSIDI